VPATAEDYLQTEQGTVGFLLTQTEGGRRGRWRNEWRSREGMWGMRREGDTNNGCGTVDRRVVKGMCYLDDKVGVSRGGTLMHV